MRRGTATLPLHGGKAPAWLMSRMIKLAREIVVIIVSDFGAAEVLNRLSDPFWFQSFGCLLGFDWHSSGVTTTVCAAVKQGISGIEADLGLFAAGGKGARSRRTPDEIAARGAELSVDPARLVYLSRLTAKVDNNALQDGYQLYIHNFFFTPDGRWAVVQQGMNGSTATARRYHWLSDTITDMTVDPHTAVCDNRRLGTVMNLTDHDADRARTLVTELSHRRPERTRADIEKIKTLALPSRHEVTAADIDPGRIEKILLSTYERCPTDFEELLSLSGVGPKTIRALALIGEVIYGAPASFSDPARFSFAHGGKDGHPYPVDRENYDRSIDTLRHAASSARIGIIEKREAIKRLDAFYRRFSHDTTTP
ncbi:MAG: DUF763 domain-containing protein [Deltaproteobacteria bacterium]|nr:DUF763 domain-containing protein [Candidatus Zymogenaceae bacterium]